MRPWIDTHLHLLYPQRLHYDWAAGIPALSGAFHLPDYLALAQPLGITRTLHMEVDVRPEEIEDETALIGELALHPSKQIAGAISACRPEEEDSRSFAAFVERATANPWVRGFRRVLHTQPDALSSSARFQANVRELTRRGHPFDLCVLPRQFPQAAALARACPDATLVLDHCGIPDIAGQGLATWRAALQELAAHDNVQCKISGVIAYGDATRWSGEGDALIGRIAADLAPYVEHVIKIFGWRRVVWGSDFPVCNLTQGLVVWKAVTDRLLQGASESELDALAHGNAQRIYRLDAGATASGTRP